MRLQRMADEKGVCNAQNGKIPHCPDVTLVRSDSR